MSTAPPELSDDCFRQIAFAMRDYCGINLFGGKEELVRQRLHKRLKALGLGDFRDYLAYVSRASNTGEFDNMVQELATNKTGFFREPQHFEYLKERILPSLKNRRLRIWSAGCSSGEEVYSLAFLLCGELRDRMSWDIKILGTDISEKVLSRARDGVYPADTASALPPAYAQRRFFLPENGPEYIKMGPEIRSLVRFARLNLMNEWPMTGIFDVIFCRNVMIYFDKPLQEALINRFWNYLPPGGHLFVGHSESLAGVRHKFEYAAPAVYRKGDR